MPAPNHQTATSAAAPRIKKIHDDASGRRAGLDSALTPSAESKEIKPGPVNCTPTFTTNKTSASHRASGHAKMSKPVPDAASSSIAIKPVATIATIEANGERSPKTKKTPATSCKAGIPLAKRFDIA